MKLFGSDLFSLKKEPGTLWDFAQFGVMGVSSMGFTGLNSLVTSSTFDGKAKPKERKKPEPTPKKLYQMGALNEREFAIQTDPTYLDEKIQEAQLKLEYLGKKQKPTKILGNEFVGIGPIKHGQDELESIIERLQNRKKIEQVAAVLDKYPHTSSALISKVLEKNTHLGYKLAQELVPDFPKAAIQAMKEYDEMCLELCNKKTVFYVLANSKDFQQVSKRRDPILLAQSPFGFFWQILGAWDEEMIYLGDL